MANYYCKFCDEHFKFEHQEFSVEMPKCPSCENKDDVIESEEDE